jgi:S-adenosylmethionine:tRNA ribosyltransferase-isomerase
MENGYLVNDIEQPFKAKILGYHDRENGTRQVEFEYEGIFMERLEEIGSMPLPPYISRIYDLQMQPSACWPFQP